MEMRNTGSDLIYFFEKLEKIFPSNEEHRISFAKNLEFGIWVDGKLREISLDDEDMSTPDVMLLAIVKKITMQVISEK